MDPERLNRSRNVAMMFGNNINHLFKDLLDRFPNNLKNWALYLDFCRKMVGHRAVVIALIHNLPIIITSTEWNEKN